MYDFSTVRAEHVEQALDLIDREGVPSGRGARTTFLIARGRPYPVKYVLGLACRFATRREPDPEEFTGGIASGEVLMALGYRVEQGRVALNQSTRPTRQPAPVPEPATPPPVAAPAPAAAVAPAQRATRARPGAPPPPRSIVTLCVKGCPSGSAATNQLRQNRLPGLLAQALAHRPDDLIDAVVLPGGYFRLGGFVGGLPFAQRAAALDAAAFGATCRTAAAALRGHSPGALLVVGVDSNNPPGEWGDQLCVAWTPEGVVGIGRKVIPVAGGEAAGLVITAEDFGDAHRIAVLPSGGSALLCSCYDGFGISQAVRRASEIERMRVGGVLLGWQAAGFDGHWQAAVEAWGALVAGADVALVAIHCFAAGKSCSMWQRHGIATGSAALGGGMVAAAAHFEGELPSSPRVQTLVSKDVPVEVLSQGQNREGNQQLPYAHLRTDQELIRWFR